MRILHARVATAATAALLGAGAGAAAMTPAAGGADPAASRSRHPHTITITAVEKGTAVNFVDVPPADTALGDQLIGTGALVDSSGRKLGTSSFQGVSTNATPRTSEMLTFVYELPGGKITTAGTALLSAAGPIFDEQFAITGGTGRYQNARGQVRVLQETVEQAKVWFQIKV